MDAKPYISAALLVALWIIEGISPFFKGRDARIRHYARNIGLALINNLVLAFVFTGLLLAATEWARQNDFGLLNQVQLPIVARMALAVVVFDAWQYTWHRLNHRLSFLWRFHAVHHTDTELDASSAVRFHTGEIVLSAVARLAVLPLLGMGLRELAVYEALLLPVILLHHSNVNFPARLDALLRLLIVTPRMHWVHHSQWRPETDSNFASIFSFWDRLFRTHRNHDDPATIVFGLDGPKRAGAGLPELLLQPFRRRERDEISASQAGPPAL